jgi:cell division protein ZipA
MNELRLALLVIGVLLVAALVGWEWYQRRAARRVERDFVTGPTADPLLDLDAVDEGVSPARVRVEPSISLDVASAREPLREPPVVRVEDARAVQGGREIPIVSSTDTDADTHVDSPAAAADVVPEVVPDALPPMQLVWPPEDRRTIVGLRIVGRNGEKLTGGSLRQALLGEGLRHGELDIFHRPLADGRVIFSAASLTRPGSFDLEHMDSQLYLGLNLFAVLPGVLAGDETFDRMVDSAQRISQRLRAELLDARGTPLSDARIAELRREAAGAGQIS